MTQLESSEKTNTLPLTADELTVEWLDFALGDIRGEHHVLNFEHEIIGVGEGLMGQLARVSLVYDDTQASAPKSIIAKFASTALRTREMAREQGYYQREISFYKDIGNDVGIPTADCYFAQHLEESNHFVILLEDLAPAVISDQIKGTCKQDSEWVIKSMARMHAKWWNSDQLANYEWAQPLINVMPAEQGLVLINEAIQQAEERGTFDRYGEMKRLMKFLPALFRMEPPPPYPFTLCHGDVRSDNLFCPSEQGGNYALIDWQLSGIAQPAGDLARWLSQSITIEQRRETEQDLLKLYHKCLVENGVTDYSYKRLIQDYQLNLVVLLLMFSMSMDDIDQTPERVKMLLHKMYSRLDAALVDWKVANLLKILPYMIPFLKLSTWLRSKLGAKKPGQGK